MESPAPETPAPESPAPVVDASPAAAARPEGTAPKRARTRRGQSPPPGTPAPETPAADAAPPAPPEPAPVPTPEPPVPAEDLAEPVNALPAIGWEDLPDALRQGATRCGWTNLMPVQAKVIPYILAGRDLMIQSRTGSGKTGAYGLPLLERIDPAARSCRALILVPTRELANQVHRDLTQMAGDTGIKPAVVYGGVGYGPQIDALRGGAQVVVGTPGRILDHLMRRTFHLEDLEVVILDEADRMLSMGFYPDMRKVREYFPHRRHVNAYLSSATFPPFVFRLAGEFLTGKDFLSLSRDRVHIAEMDHLMYEVPAMDRDRALVRIIEFENPLSAIVFCNTKARVHYVSVVLQRFGFNADELSADISQAAREKVLGRLRTGELRFLVATDLAARGIDIPELSHVIQYEVGEDPESYIHRAGRTARAGAGGTSLSLVAGMEEFKLLKIAKAYGVKMIKRSLPSEDDLAELVTERVTAFLESDLRQRDKLQVERMRRFASLARGLADNDELCGLVAMLLDDYYQEALHGRFTVVPPEPVMHRRDRDDGRPRYGDRDRPRRGDGDRPRHRDGDRPRPAEGDGPRFGDGDRPRQVEADRSGQGEGDRPRPAEGDRPPRTEGDGPREGRRRRRRRR
ncbi:MAG: DEAD/DEAH box helicase [Acidobacteria bacterium]|nr:DEAD/DEAH box helicase [Acidobacteriota bacterium]